MLVDRGVPLCFNPNVMARICQICQKTAKKGNSVPRGIGKRVTRRTIRRQQPNLRNKRFEVDGKRVKLTLCASCLKRTKKDPEYVRKAFE
ncbi:50S ribosomal protein L28 [candidate division WWE3 bacterium]|nr:50S ribosomal protein L28 [candidate division WWE3 bacterium]